MAVTQCTRLPAGICREFVGVILFLAHLDRQTSGVACLGCVCREQHDRLPDAPIHLAAACHTVHHASTLSAQRPGPFLAMGCSTGSSRVFVSGMDHLPITTIQFSDRCQLDP